MRLIPSWDTAQQIVRIAGGWVGFGLVVSGVKDSSLIQMGIGLSTNTLILGWWIWWQANRPEDPAPMPEVEE